MKFIDLSAQYKELKTDIDARIFKVLEHGQYIMGPEVFELEERLSSYVDVKHTISCANGTDALSIALRALNVDSQSAVFCPTFTFFSTAEVIALIGANPVFVDSCPETFNLCPMHLEQQIQKVIEDGIYEPKVIIAVDLFGLPADYPKIKTIASKYNLKIIEDGAQGFGGEINGVKACSFGDISTTSFFPAKPLGCYGDGGAIFTNNDEYNDIMCSLRVHGKGKDKYDNVRIGYNSRLDTLQAAILIEKLKVFPSEVEKRNKIAEHYNEIYRDRFKIPSVPAGYYSSWAQYTVISSNRDMDMKTLALEGIPTMVYYQTCMHQQTAFRHLNLTDDQFPNASRLCKTVFSLPMYPYLEIKK